MASTINRAKKKNKPVWLWKWTIDAYHVYKQKKKDGKL